MLPPLLTTKLYIPSVRPDPSNAIRTRLVSRPRLIAQLNAGLERKLTLISAPAGFGKTTLLSEWATTSGRPVAWVSLDKSDNDPTQFWAYFITALQTIQAGLGRDILAALESARSPSIEPLLTGLINEIAKTPPPSVPGPGRGLAIVLDDLHVITERQVHDALTFLLDNLPPQMHLTLSSRADPPWSLARLRARGEMAELRAADLRFTAGEATAFLNDVMELSLPAEDIAALEARTEGWIAGLQLAALSMQGRKDIAAFIRAFSASHHFIVEYLVDEVLDQQPPEVQEFLLKTSVLERMTAPLCDATANRDDSRCMLAHLDKANLFLIPLDDEQRWYRYHHLFANLLRLRLKQTTPDQVSSLHLGASEWYEQNELLADAVNHALAAGDAERVARLVEGNAIAIVEHGELSSLIRQLDALPDEAVCAHPWLCIAYAWALSYAGRVDSIEPLLRAAEKGLDETDGHAEARSILGRIAALRGYVADLEGDSSRSLMFGREALKHISQDDLSLRAYVLSSVGISLRKLGDLSDAAQAFAQAVALSRRAGDSQISVMVLCRLATLQIWQGQLNRAATTCQDALSLTREHARREGQQLPATGYAHIQMSRVLCEWNDLEAAHRHARKGIELSQRWGQADVLAFGYYNLGRILYRQRDLEGLLEVTQKIERAVDVLPAWFVPDAMEVKVMYHLASGDAGGAFRLAQEQGMGNPENIFLDRYFNHFTFVRLLIVLGKTDPDRLDEALELLAQLLSMAEATGARGYEIESLALQAIVLWAKGKRDPALVALERALFLAEPESHVRVFADGGAPMGELLRQSAVRGIAVNYAGRLLAALEKEAKSAGDRAQRGATISPPASLIELPSARELEVLRLLTTHLPVSEIARELGIAPSTVRSHVKNIYGKLNVHSRSEAVEQARELKLL